MRGHVRKRGQLWCFVIEVGRDSDTGRRRQKWYSGFRTKADAQRALTETLSRVDRGIYVEPTKQTISEFLDEWLNIVEPTLRATTFATYSTMVRNHIKRTIGHIPLQRLTVADVNALYSSLLKGDLAKKRKPLSAATVRYVHSVLSKSLKDAVRWDKVPRNVCAFAEAPRPKRTTREHVTWTGEEIRRFLDATSEERLHAAWLLAVATGMRRGELLGLRWADIDFDNATASIRQTVVAVGHAPEFTQPKTATSRRSVALDAGTVRALRDHRKRQAAERLRAGRAYAGHDLLFCSELGEPIIPRQMTKWFHAAAKRAGVRRIRFHDLRHTHATLALQSGIHPKVVQERLGHAEIGITMNTYTHAIPSMQADAAETIASLWASP